MDGANMNAQVSSCHVAYLLFIHLLHQLFYTTNINWNIICRSTDCWIYLSSIMVKFTLQKNLNCKLYYIFLIYFPCFHILKEFCFICTWPSICMLRYVFSKKISLQVYLDLVEKLGRGNFRYPILYIDFLRSI
jgi:hypothetical protein